MQRINTSSLQANQQVQTSSIEQNQSAAVAKNTQLLPVAAAAPLAPQTTGATTVFAGGEGAAAAGVKDAVFSTLPEIVVHGGVLSLLDPQSLAHFSQTSEASMQYTIESANTQLQSLNEELKQLITDSGIREIKIPKDPFRDCCEIK